MNRDTEEVQAALFQSLGSMDQPNCLGIHTFGVARKPPRPWGKFSRVTNWVCSRRLYVRRHAFIFPFYLCSTFIFTISASSSYTLLPDFLPFLLPSHSFSLQTSPFSQYEVLHSPQHARPRRRCCCPTDYSQLNSHSLHAVYFNFRLLDSGGELRRRL